MGLELQYIKDQTPISEEEKEGLLLFLDTNNELNEAEQKNITLAIEWTKKTSFYISDILSEEFLNRVHKNMFGDVWRWAGTYRKTNKNIGVDKFDISTELKKVFDDCRYWIENKTFNKDEIAIRLKHRIVLIHPYPNGNGRHSRLIGDILINKYFGLPVFSWSNNNLTNEGEARAKYLSALRKADNGNYEDLIIFARS